MAELRAVCPWPRRSAPADLAGVAEAVEALDVVEAVLTRLAARGRTGDQLDAMRQLLSPTPRLAALSASTGARHTPGTTSRSQRRSL